MTKFLDEDYNFVKENPALYAGFVSGKRICPKSWLIKNNPPEMAVQAGFALSRQDFDKREDNVADGQRSVKPFKFRHPCHILSRGSDKSACRYGHARIINVYFFASRQIE